MTPPLSERRLFLSGIGLAAIGAVCFSGKAILAKLLYREGLDAVDVLALRMQLSVPFFLLVAAWTWRQAPRLKARDLLRCIGLGLIGYYASSMLDFMGLQYITAGLERLILFLTPSFVLLLNRLVLKRAVSGAQWLSLGVAYAGIVLVFQHDLSVGADDVALGAALVLASAVTYAVYLLLSGELLKRVGTLRLVALAMTASSVAALLQYGVLRPFASLFQQSAAVWQLSLLNATLCTVAPVFLTMLAVARIGAGPAAQTGMVGPVSTLFLGAWLLAEPITPLQLAGTALVIGGIVLLTLQRPQPPLPPAPVAAD